MQNPRTFPPAPSLPPVSRRRRATSSRVRTLLGLACLFGAMAPAAARTGLCDAPWLRDGAEIRLAFRGGVPGEATISLSGVRKSEKGKGECSASVGVTTRMAMPGVDNASRQDYALTVAEGRMAMANRARGKLQGKAADNMASGDLEAMGVGALGYAGLIEREGQRLAGESQTLRMYLQMAAGGYGMGTETMPSMQVSTSAKVVGKRTDIETRLGRKSCWPVRYQRTTTTAPVTVSGRTVSVPPARAAVTDWYCPDMGLVMKQETVQGEQTGTMEVMAVK